MHDNQYDYRHDVAEEHMHEIRAEAEEHQRSLLVRCCSGVSRLYCEAKNRLRRNGKDEAC